MSWLEKVNSNFIIVTGDSKRYSPQWLNAVKSFDFNVSEFEFINQGGALVDRREPKARRFNLTIVFQGEDVLDLSDNFERSSRDKRPWTITHPMYGDLTVHPLGLNFDNSKLNVVTITSTIVETGIIEFPDSTVSIQDEVDTRFENCNSAFIDSFSDVKFEAADEQDIKNQNRKSFVLGSKLTTGEDATAYFNAFNTANNAMFVSQDNPIQAVTDAQAFILAPSKFIQSAQIRTKLLLRQFQELQNFFPNIARKNQKNIYQQNGGGIISAMALSTATPQPNDYLSAIDVLNIAETLTSVNNQFLSSLDSLQTFNGGALDSFIPDYPSMQTLFDLVNFTIVNLINLALESKRERSIITETDTNIMLLAHRLYGLDDLDVNLENLINQNNLSFDEYLFIPKGKKIIYFV